MEGLQKNDLQSIFTKTKQKNTEAGISGILLYGMGDFFQVLEGEKSVITSLYENVIKNDPRHEEFFEVINKKADAYIFRNYSSEFEIINSNEKLDDLKKYLKNNRINSRSDKLNRLLRPFILLDEL